jgi:adiponectin receptor
VASPTNGQEDGFNVLDTLDIAMSQSYLVGEWHAVLDTSLLQAMRQLETVRSDILVSEESDGCYSELDNETEAVDEDEEGDAGRPSVRAMDERFLPARLSRKGGGESSKDVERLEAFLQEAHALLQSIREDVQSHLPALPTKQDLIERFPTASATVAAADPRQVLERLSYNWHRAQQVYQHLSVLSVPFSLPEMPEAISAISSSARASLANQKRRFTMSFSPTSSTVPSPSSEKPNPFSPSYLPTPPLSAVRAFLREESTRLQNKLPSTPSLGEWKEGLSNALHEASDYAKNKGEQIKDFVEEEAERLRNALDNGTTRLLHYSELPLEWRNNKHILSGYRFVPIDRPVELIWGGLTTLHNETFNSKPFVRLSHPLLTCHQSIRT